MSRESGQRIGKRATTKKQFQLRSRAATGSQQDAVSYVVDRTRSPKPTPRGSMIMAPAPVPRLTWARDDTSIWHARPALTTDDIRRTGSRHSWALASDSVVMDGKSSGRGRNQEGSDGDTASSDGRARHTQLLVEHARRTRQGTEKTR
jgi:hypothetical protein